MKTPRPKRLLIGFAVLATIALIAVAVVTLLSVDPQDYAEELRTRIHQRTAEWVQANQLPREDEHIYTIDIAQLAIYAAMRKDAALFEPLRQHLMERILIDSEDDLETRGFVAWQWAKGKPLDASGTTEMLRTAEALWLCAEGFGEEGYRDAAVNILRGYLRHASVDQGVWLIRNYFNLQTRTYATNSFLVDYDPDLLYTIGHMTRQLDLIEAADQSARVVEQAVAPSGLLHMVIQPEMKTLLPRLNAVFFSPNNIEQLANVATVAERCVKRNPQQARAVLDFALERLDHLHLYYNASTGKAVSDTKASATVYAALLRLAVRLKDHDARDRLLVHVNREAERWLNNTAKAEQSDLYTASELLLAYQVMFDWPLAPPPPPEAILVASPDHQDAEEISETVSDESDAQ